MEKNHNELSYNEIISRLDQLELRLSRLEESPANRIQHAEELEEPELFKSFKSDSDGSLLETKIGESGLAWLGNIVLFFGIAFLVQYLQNTAYPIVSPVLGYISVAGIFLLANYLKQSYPTMASVFNLNAYLLLFYVTLKLHFFSSSPIIANEITGLILLLLIASIELFISVRQKFALLATISIVLFSITSIVSNSTHFMLSIILVMAILSVILMLMYGWLRTLYLSIFLSYLVFLLWFLNNPIMGNQMQAITEHNYGFVYLFLIGATYSIPAMMPVKETVSNSGLIGSLVLNGLGFSLLLFLFTLSFFKNDYVALVGSVSAFCIVYAVFLQLKSDFKINAALYALYGFITLSIALYGIYGIPRAYFLLAIQSVLVVSMAIWFRSKFIVVMNTFLYLILLIFYLQSLANIDGVDISFSIAALVTARILNWKKDRLTIKTDMLRNIYLLIGFVMVLITLYHVVPAHYVVLSWTSAAIVYFILSLILKNVKYRYMALGTMIAATFYLFIVDLATIELVFRIIALLFLALISIGLSIYYSKKNKKDNKLQEE